MKNYIYPAVLYFVADDDDYMLHIEDLNVFAYGQNVEEAMHNANNLVASYIQLSLRIDMEIPDSTPYELMVQKHPKQTILLLEARVDEKTNKVIMKHA